MSVPVLAPCLVQLRAAIDTLCPNRDRTSDGWIGDAAHAETNSQHNPDARGVVHAIDVDKDLNEAGLSLEMIVQHLLGRARARADLRITEIIYRRRIWTERHQWTERPYSGVNAHLEHAHFTGSDERILEQNRTQPYHLEEIPVALTADDREWIAATIDTTVQRWVGDVVQRHNADGSVITGTDNDTMAVASALGYISNDAGLVRRQVRDQVVPALDRIGAAVARIEAAQQ